MQKAVGPDIYVRVHITNIKRDPKCGTQEPLDKKLTFFEKVRQTGKELVAEEEFSNAKTLYSRCISIFKNMPKKQKESLTEEQDKQRNEILSILYLNCSHCLIKKKMYKEGIKAANDSLIYIKDNPKAYYRIGVAYREEKDYERSQENFKKAIQLNPNDKNLREEYKKLLEIKSTKEKERF